MFLQTPILPKSRADAPRRGSRSLGLRFMDFASAQLLAAERHLSRAGEARHVGIHEARKCLRRVRALLAFGRGVLDSRAARLDIELRRINRGLSVLRDAQALIEALRRLNASASPELRASLPQAMRAASESRDRILARAMQVDPDFRSRRRRLLAARSQLARLDWQSVVPDVLRSALRRSEMRYEKAGRRAQRRRDDDQAWHTLRRRLRQLRQQDSLLAELRPGVRSALKDLENRAIRLGESQDDALLLSRCGPRSPFPPEQRKLLRAVARQRLGSVRRG